MPTSIVPTIRYEDAPKMIGWLCDTFGFARHLVIDDGHGRIAHAQLERDGAMIMLGSARDDEFGRLQGTARELGRVTQSIYMIVDDVDSICESARQAGADILIEPKDEDYGGRGFTCRDPEGQIWNFGTYDPWRSDK